MKKGVYKIIQKGINNEDITRILSALDANFG